MALLVSIVLLTANTAWGQASKPTIEQTTKPLGLEEAGRKCPIPLPKEAKNIQYARYSDWAVHQSFVRFEVPHEIGVAHVEKVFREHARRMKWRFRSPTERAITKPPRLSLTPASDLRIGWFAIGSIRHGKTYGELNSWQPQVWIDTNRNLFFFCLTD